MFGNFWNNDILFLHGCYLKSKDYLFPITRVFRLIHEYNYFENIVQGQTNLHKKEWQMEKDKRLSI